MRKFVAILMGLVVESWRTRTNHTFIRKFYGTFFDYPFTYGNLAKILGNINALPNIIGVKPFHPKTLGGVNYTLC